MDVLTAFPIAAILTPFILLPVAWWVDRRERDRRTDEQLKRGLRYLRKRGEV